MYVQGRRYAVCSVTLQASEFPRSAFFRSLNCIYRRSINIQDYNFTWCVTLPVAFMEDHGQAVFKRKVQRKMLGFRERGSGRRMKTELHNLCSSPNILE